MFENREQAGQLLAGKIEGLKIKNGVILAIPRGGVVVAKVIAQHLSLPLDVVTVRKIGASWNPELAIGAMAPDGQIYWDKKLCQRLSISTFEQKALAKAKKQEVKTREKTFRAGKAPLDIVGKIAILVDDGVATGATVLAGNQFLRRQKVKKAILATPVIARDTLNRVKKYFDEVVFLSAPEEFYAVGQFYQDFPQVSDNEVVEMLKG